MRRLIYRFERYRSTASKKHRNSFPVAMTVPVSSDSSNELETVRTKTSVPRDGIALRITAHIFYVQFETTCHYPRREDGTITSKPGLQPRAA